MKKVILAFLAAGLFTAPSFATINTQAEEVVAAQDANKEVAINELPEAVKAALSSEALKDFKAEKAVVTAGENPVYEITGKQGDAVLVVKIDANGQIVK